MRDTQPPQPLHPGAEQACYARLLWWSGWSGLLVLALGFIAYVGGVLPPLIGVEELPRVWTLSARQLAEQEGHPSGWDWIGMLERGDIFTLLGIAVLASCSSLPLTVVAALYWRRRERLYALLSVFQVAVLLMAASGLIAAGD
jgi:hypothetical protein